MDAPNYEDLSEDNPFPGLRAFEADEDHLFFGRDDQVDQLLMRLRETRFLAIVGASGSGKSSLTRSGLIPCLHSGFMASAGSSWRVAVTLPGDDPIGNLAEALNDPEVLGPDPDQAEMNLGFLEATLRRSSAGLARCYQGSRLPEDENLLIVVDQFEELFRYRREGEAEDSEDEARAFTQLLLKAADQSACPIYIVLTMRSDFIGQCAEIPGLAEAVNDGQFLVPQMTRDDYRQAIAGPIAVGGGAITPRLVERLLNEIGTSQDQLPLLQHALMRTWDYWLKVRSPGEKIDTRHYDAIGTMEGALAQHAEEAYSDLPDARSRKICEALFRMITDGSSEARGIRRPQSLAAIAEAAACSEAEVLAVVEVFRASGRSFLRPAEGVEIRPDTTIDISHESLMRVWDRLVSWVQLEAEDARTYLRLCEDARSFNAESIRTLQDPMLQVALNWRETAQPTEAWALRYDPALALMNTFLDASRDERDSDVQLRERKREAAFLLWKRVALAGLLLVVTLIGVFAWGVSQGQLVADAEQKTKAAEEKTKLAEDAKQRADAETKAAQKLKAEAEADAKQAEMDAKRESAKAQAEKKKANAETKKAAEAQAEADRAQEEMEELEQEQRRAEQQLRVAKRERKEAEEQKEQLVAQKAVSENQVACHNYVAEVVEARTERTRMAREALQVARGAPLVASQDRQIGAGLILEAHNVIRELDGLDSGLPKGEGKQACERDPELKGLLPSEGWKVTTAEDEAALGLALNEVWREFDGTSGENESFAGVPVRALATDPNSGEVFYGLADGDVAASEGGHLDSGCDSIRSLALAAGGDKGVLVAGCFSGEIRALPIDSQKSALVVDAGAPVSSLAGGAQEHEVIYATASGAVGVIDLSGPRQDWTGAPLPGVSLAGIDAGRPAFVSTSRDGRTLALAWHAGGRVALARYEHRGGAWVETWKRSRAGRANAFAVDPSGTRVAIGLGKGGVVVWEFDAASGQLRKTAQSQVNGVAFDGLGHVAAAGADGTVYVWTHCDWSAAKGRCGESQFDNVARPPLEFEHDGRVWALAFGASGATRDLYSGDEKGKGYRWSVDSDDIYERMCAQIEEPLDEMVWRSRFVRNAERLDDQDRAWTAHCPKGGER